MIRTVYKKLFAYIFCGISLLVKLQLRMQKFEITIKGDFFIILKVDLKLSRILKRPFVKKSQILIFSVYEFFIAPPLPPQI